MNQICNALIFMRNEYADIKIFIQVIYMFVFQTGQKTMIKPQMWVLNCVGCSMSKLAIDVKTIVDQTHS